MSKAAYYVRPFFELTRDALCWGTATTMSVLAGYPTIAAIFGATGIIVFIKTVRTILLYRRMINAGFALNSVMDVIAERVRQSEEEDESNAENDSKS